MMSDREIPFGEIEETDETLGTGNYGKVFKVSYFGAVCAAKEFSSGLRSGAVEAKADNLKAGSVNNEAKNDLKDYFLNKHQPLIQFRHPNIVQLMGIYFKPDPSKVRPVMVMEKMDCSLSTFLASHPYVSNGVKISILLDISVGLRYLHGQKPPVIHCNLTSNNVLLTSQLQAKISDVGIIQMMGNQKKIHVQCGPFMAPEVRTSMLNRTLTESAMPHPSADIFSFGTVVLHTITQEQPEPLADDSVKHSVKPQTEVERHQLQINQLAARSKSLKSLVIGCLDNDPNKRPTIIQVSEKMKKWSEKLPVVNKNSIAWQAEVEEAIKQQNDLEIKLANERKAKEQLQIQNENLLKLIQVNCTTLLEKTFKIQNEENDSTRQTQVEQSQQKITGNKIGKANSLQHRFSSGDIPKSFQLVLEKDSSQNATNSTIEYVKFQSKLEDLPKAITKCPHHPKYDLNKYCIDCEVELCPMCSSNHQSHEVNYFSTILYKHKCMESKIQELLKDVQVKKSKLDKKNMEIQKKATQSREAMKAGFANLHKTIDMQEKKILQRLTLQVENMKKECELYLNIYSMHMVQLKSFLNTTRLISKQNYYKSAKSLDQHGENLLLIGRDLKIPMYDGLLEIPTGEFESVCTEIAALGISPDAKKCSLVSSPKVVLINRKETVVVIMKDEEGYTISNCKGKLAVEFGHTSMSVPTDVRELGDGRCEISYVLKCSGEYSLKIKVCGVDIPGTPCKITCKLSDWSSSLPVAIAPSPLPGGAISDHYQFKIKAFNQTTAVVEIGGKCNDGTPRHYKLKGLSYGDELKISVSGSIGTLHEKFQALFKEVNTPKSPSAIDPQNILQQIAAKNPRFRKRTQEDSHEVLRCLLTEMKNEELERIGEKIHQHFGVIKDQSLASLDGETKLMLKNYLRGASNTGSTPIEKVVSGVRLNTVICRSCHTPIQSEEAFFDISLQIPDDAPAARTSAYSAYITYSWQSVNTQQSYSHGDTSSHSTALDADGVQSLLIVENMFHQPTTDVTRTQQLTGLEKSLAAHTSVDNMDENNKFVCTECSKSAGGEVFSLVCKQLLLHQLPQVLILHLKRFTVGPYTVTKNKAHVSFPPMLNMAPYSSNACLKKFGDNKNNILYGLYAVVEHIGSTLSVGHYIAYVRRRPKRDKQTSPQAAKVKWIYDEAAAHDGLWFRTSDLTITECSRGFKDVEKSEAYLLFYELLPNKLL